MSPAPSASELSISWKVVFGLAEPDAAGWPRVRAAQLSSLLNALPLIAVVQIVNAASLTWLLWHGRVPIGAALWLSAIILVLLSGAMLHRSARSYSANEIRPGATRGAAAHALLLGALWSVPPLFFVGDATEQQRAALYLICYAMMTSGTLTASTIPQVALLYIAANAFGLTVMIASYGNPILALMPPVYAVALVLCAFLNSRSFIRRKCGEIALEEKNEVVSLLLREFEENGADWLWQIDVAKQLVGVSARLARAAGSSPTQLEGMPLLRLFAGESWETGELSVELKELFEKLQRRESFKDIVVPISVDGETRWWCLSATPRLDEHGRFLGFRGVGSDQTEQRRSVQRIDKMARLDSLTGLLNRREITSALRNALAIAQRDRGHCALMLIDLDRFKAVNDTLGHPVGDRLLKLVAERISAQLAPTDLGGRLGGDEFAIVVTDARDADRVDRLAAAVVATLGQPFQIDEQVVRIGASAGIALAPRHGRTVETLIRHADMALYEAKKAGRGTHRSYAPRLLAGADRRRALDAAMREALDAGSPALDYWPVLNAAGDAHLFEARLRWSDPRLQECSDDELASIANESALGARILDWTVRTACADAAAWEGDARVAVTISRIGMLDSAFAATLLSALSHAGLAPDRLEINIPETLLAERYQEAVAAMARLRTLGLRLALDDFGSGFAALSLVRPAHFTSLKLHPSLLRSARQGSLESLAGLRASLVMAATLGLETVARGADTEELARYAFDLGCLGAAGEASGPAVDATAVGTLLAKARRFAA